MSDSWLEDMFRRGEEQRAKKERLFEKLMLDYPCATPSVGDRVIEASGLLGRGFDWVRQECLVLEVASTSVKVRFGEKPACLGGGPDDEWIHPALITDAIPAATVAKE